MGKIFSLALLAACLFALMPSSAIAGTGIFGSYIGMDSGLGNYWYGATQPGGNYRPQFNTADLGDFTVGDSLIISGGELLTWKNSGDNVTGTNLYYAIHLAGTAANTFGGSTINYTSDVPFNDAAGNTFINGGDQKWADIQDTPDVLLGVGAGDYNLSVYFTSSTSIGTIYDNNGGNYYVANFSVTGVPEPAAFLLILAGLTPLALQRRRK